MSDAPLTRVQAAAVAIYAHSRGEEFDFALPHYRKLAFPPDGTDAMRRYFEGFATKVLEAADRHTRTIAIEQPVREVEPTDGWKTYERDGPLVIKVT